MYKKISYLFSILFLSINTYSNNFIYHINFINLSNDLNYSVKIKQLEPKKNEISIWEISIKKFDNNNNYKNKQEIIIKELSEDINFIKWWTTKINGFPVQKSLPIFYLKKNNENSIVAEISFLPFLEQAEGITAMDNGAAAIIYYDVTKSPPITSNPVKLSDINLTVWDSEVLELIRINQKPGFIKAKDSNGNFLPIDEVNPYYMYFKNK